MPANIRGLPLNCEQCNEPANSGIGLMQHMVNSHKVELHPPDDCDYCKMKFSSNQELIDHAQLDELIEISGPILVSSVIIEPKKEIQAEEGEENVHMCTECNAKCTTETELDIHVEQFHTALPKEKKIHLKLTGDLTEELSKIVIPEEEQVKINEAEKEAKEDIIKILNIDFGDMKGNHENSQIRFKCNVCNFSTSTDRNLRMHRKTLHSEIQDTYKCDVCKKQLDNKSELLKHIKSKHQDSKCHICQFTAVSPSYLKSHMKRKHEKESYQCDECPESFKTKMNLVYHKRNHVAAFKCDHCEFKGVSINALRYHMTHRHVKENSPMSGVKREASIKITKEFKKAKKEMSPRNEKSNSNTLPKKESEVIGGNGWSLNKREEEIKKKHMDQVTTQSEEKNEKPTTTQKETNSTKIDIKELKKKLSTVPEKCRPQLPEDYKDSFVHHVLGDGACGIRCLLAHLKVKEDELEKYSEELNIFMFHNQMNLEPKLSYPMTVRHGPSGKKKHFTNADEHFQWLKVNKDALKVWRECGDVKAISNQFNMNIMVMRMNKEGELELPIQEYAPDDEYKWEDNKETAKESRPMMILINKSDHFSLVVKNEPEESSEVKHKDSTQSNDKEEEEKTDKENTTIEKLIKEVEHLKEIVKSQQCKCKEKEHNEQKDKEDNGSHHFSPHSNKAFLGEKAKDEKSKQKYSEIWKCGKCGKCGITFTTNPLLERHMTNKHSQQKEEVGPSIPMRFSKLSNCDICGDIFTKPEFLQEHKHNSHKDNEEMVDINDHPESSELEDMDIEDKNRQGKFKCKVCKLVQNTKSKLETHMKNHDEEADWICDGDILGEECSFQSNERTFLESHMKEKGHTSEMIWIRDIEQTPSSTNQSPLQPVQTDNKQKKCPFCNDKFTSNSTLAQHRRENHPTSKPCRNIAQCKFGIECFYSHIPIQEGYFRCFQCGEEFETINLMMLHRKGNHDGVKMCKKFLEDNCTKGSECWWLHETVDFQQIPENPAPPEKVWTNLKPKQTDQTPNVMNNTILKMMTSLQETIITLKMFLEQQTQIQQ